MGRLDDRSLCGGKVSSATARQDEFCCSCHTRLGLSGRLKVFRSWRGIGRDAGSSPFFFSLARLPARDRSLNTGCG